MDQLKTVKEIAPILNHTEARVYQLIREGFFPERIICKFGRQIRINERLLIHFLENGSASKHESGGER